MHNKYLALDFFEIKFIVCVLNELSEELSQHVKERASVEGYDVKGYNRYLNQSSSSSLTLTSVAANNTDFQHIKKPREKAELKKALIHFMELKSVGEYRQRKFS